MTARSAAAIFLRPVTPPAIVVERGSAPPPPLSPAGQPSVIVWEEREFAGYFLLVAITFHRVFIVGIDTSAIAPGLSRNRCRDLRQYGYGSRSPHRRVTLAYLSAFAAWPDIWCRLGCYSL